MGELPGAVLFDLDGTLLESEQLWMQSAVEVMNALGSVWSYEDQAKFIGGPLALAAEHMSQRVDKKTSAGDIAGKLLMAQEEQIRRCVLPWKPGALPLLREAADTNLPRALVTASWRRLVDVLVERINVDVGARAFSLEVAGDEVSNGKPDPEPYLKAAKALLVPPVQCLVVEDSPKGVQSAVSAGCHVVAVQDSSFTESAGVLVVGSLEAQTLENLWLGVTT